MAREQKSDPPPPPTPELTKEDCLRLVAAIKKIDKSAKMMAEAGLNRRAIVTLLHDVTQVGKRDINDVLNGLDMLGETFLEKTKEK